jgi:oligoendopeptidase F
MPTSLPKTSQEFMRLPWQAIQPFYQELASRPLDDGSLNEWLADWTALHQLGQEAYWRLYVMVTTNTADEEARELYNAFLENIHPKVQEGDQALTEKLLASGLQPPDFETPMKMLQAEASLFRQENLPLLSDELKLSNDYERILGEQTVEWQGAETTILQLQQVYQDPDREKRERAWRLGAQRQLADREAINAVWVQLMSLRREIAANADLPDFRAYRWLKLQRFDYTPEDCTSFQRAIEEVAVPAARQVYEKRRRLLGVEQLRPWDVEVDPLSRPPLRPFETIAELEENTAAIFHRVDPQLGEYFEIMRREGLLDLDNRKNKAPGGYCTEFSAVRLPFIFANSVGVHDDVQTLLHEGGHAFHNFEKKHLPYHQQREVPLEIAEVASMSMELLASPYLSREQGGFYTPAEAARAIVETLERWLLFWPYMAVVDAFQHWVYANPEQGSDPDQCDRTWAALWDRFMLGIDWSGLEAEKATGWQRKAHIHTDPFYYVEYGLAQLGALQVYRNSLNDQASAVAAYRRALSLGYTAPLPKLYAAAGARFAFDAATLRQAVDLVLGKVSELEVG